MTKFWFMTYSTTAALGWVALGSTGAQAVDSLPPEELTGESLQLAQVDRDAIATAQPSLLQDTMIVEVEPTPSVEFSPIAPTAAYQAPPAPLPEVIPVPSNQAPAFIEQDPTLQAAINPQTPAQRAAIRTTPPESLIRDGRSFEELIAPSSEQNRQRTADAPEQITTRTARSAVLEAEPMVRREPSQVLTQPQQRNTAPLLQKLEQDLQQIRREITGSTRPLALDSPMITLTPLPDLGEYQYFSDRNPNAPQNSTAWEAVSLSREFALPTVEATTATLAPLDIEVLATDFADLERQFFSDRLVSDFFLGNAHVFDVEQVALTFTDVATEFVGMFTDWEPVLTAETVAPMADLAPETTFFNVTPTAADYFAQYKPTNPLTFGFKPDFTL